MSYQICLLQICFYSSQPSWISINTLTERANLTPVSRLFWWRVYEQHHLQNTILVYGCVENKIKGRCWTHVSNVSKSYRLCRETTQTMTNLSELSWVVSLTYLSCRDDKAVTSEASGNLPDIHNLVKVAWTHWIGLFQRSLIWRENVKVWDRRTFAENLLLTAPNVTPTTWLTPRVRLAFAYSRERVSACDRPESEYGWRVTEERRWVA